MTKPQRVARAKVPPFPRDTEVRQALLKSGMRPLAVWRAMSHLLRLTRWDFCGRRKRRLYHAAAMRMGIAELKEKVASIASQHSKDTGTALNVDDLLIGSYSSLLTDFGPGDVDNAIKELVREGVLRREKRAGLSVLRTTGRRLRGSATPLRQALEQMKLHLHIRYTAEYETERTYRM